MKLSECFRKLQADYANMYGVGNWELYWKLSIIYTYHEYAISAYYNCNKLYSEYQWVTALNTNDPEWIFAENSYHSAVFWIYTNWAILLDLLKSINDTIRADNNQLAIDDLNKITEEFLAQTKDFKDIRNNITAHPYEEWSSDGFNKKTGLCSICKKLFCNSQGKKSIRYVIPVSSEGSGGHLNKLVFRMFDTKNKDFSKNIEINPYKDIQFLNEYMDKLCVVYIRYFNLSE